MTVPSAKSAKDTTLYGMSGTGKIVKCGTGKIVKYGTNSDFHTSLYATYKNEPSITVQNTVQRKNSSGKGTNVVQNNYVVKEVKRSYIINISLTKTADTKSLWLNLNKGTTIKADLYINNGFDHDIDIVAKYVGDI